MKNYTITVNGNVYDVTVEETGSTPSTASTPRRAAAPAAAQSAAPARPVVGPGAEYGGELCQQHQLAGLCR